MASDETFVTYTDADKGKNPSTESALEEPSFYPPYKWGLGHVSKTNFKMFIKDILDLKQMPMFPMAYQFHGHPIYNVEIVGNLLLIDSRRMMDIYGIDDGTACLKCVVWKRETNLLDPSIVEEVGARLSKARLGSLVSFTGRVKTYKEKNELTVEGCHVLDSWKELILFRSLTINCYETLYFRAPRLPYQVTEVLKDYFYEKSTGKKSRRWIEGRVERKILESLDGKKRGTQMFSLDFLDDENITDWLRSGLQDQDDAIRNAIQKNTATTSFSSASSSSSSSRHVQTWLLEIIAKMESKGLIYYLPFGSHKAHYCVLIDRDCQLTKATLAKLKQLAKSAKTTSNTSTIDNVESGFPVKTILSYVRSSNEEFCLVQKVAIERCLEILENESEVYGIGKYRFMPV